MYFETDFFRHKMASRSDLQELQAVFGDISEDDFRILIEEFAGKGEQLKSFFYPLTLLCHLEMALDHSLSKEFFLIFNRY